MTSTFRLTRAEFKKIFKKPSVYIMAIFIVLTIFLSMYIFKPMEIVDPTISYGTQLNSLDYYNIFYNKDKDTKLTGGQKETTAVFSRETRICRICTTIYTQNCKTTGSKSWFHNNRNVTCESGTPTENCQDIQM
jgi:hypothetical protein